ncbi:MAG: cyclic nucleotide-binding domain-containing protein [Deltaproteobacteria bacterium]|nr:cyclic nucleotide-binding domain-containing protein [Deltaproteobacteria bacterium]
MHPMWSNIFRKNPAEESLAAFLGTVPVFCEASKKDLILLETLVHVRHYRSQETIFEEGDPGSGMFIIRSGRVSIFDRQTDHGEEELALLGPGDFFGETTLTAAIPRIASARTLEPTELVSFFRSDLQEIAQKKPMSANRILIGLAKVVSERLVAVSRELRMPKNSPERASSTAGQEE